MRNRPPKGRPGRGGVSPTASTLRRRRRRPGAGATLGHERIELGLVLGHAQTAKEVVKLALLLFEAPQRLLAVFVEGAISARTRRRLPPRSGLTAGMPTVHCTAFPTAHSSAPDDEGQGR